MNAARSKDRIKGRSDKAAAGNHNNFKNHDEELSWTSLN